MIKRKKGFTLLELLIVVIIIGILASMAIPQYQKIIRKSKAAEALTNLAALRCSMDRYWYEQVAMGDGYIVADRINLLLGDAGEISLDIENPNSVDLRKWNYSIQDAGNNIATSYVLQAVDINEVPPDPIVTWIEMDQHGEIRKSTNLGGGNVPFPAPQPPV